MYTLLYFCRVIGISSISLYFSFSVTVCTINTGCISAVISEVQYWPYIYFTFYLRFNFNFWFYASNTQYLIRKKLEYLPNI